MSGERQGSQMRHLRLADACPLGLCGRGPEPGWHRQAVGDLTPERQQRVLQRPERVTPGPRLVRVGEPAAHGPRLDRRALNNADYHEGWLLAG